MSQIQWSEPRTPSNAREDGDYSRLVVPVGVNRNLDIERPWACSGLLVTEQKHVEDAMCSKALGGMTFVLGNFETHFAPSRCVHRVPIASIGAIDRKGDISGVTDKVSLIVIDQFD